MTAPYPATAKQMELLRFITGFQEAKGCTPSPRAIRDAFGWASHSNGHYILRGLIERGHVIDRGDEIEVLHPPAIPRGPKGEPLFYVRVEG